MTDENGDPVTDGNGNPVNSTTTNSSGIYSFSNLEPGTYQVVFTNPDGKYKLSPYNVGSITADSNGLWSTATDRITSYNVCYTKLLRRDRPRDERGAGPREVREGSRFQVEGGRRPDQGRVPAGRGSRNNFV